MIMVGAVYITHLPDLDADPVIGQAPWIEDGNRP